MHYLLVLSIGGQVWASSLAAEKLPQVHNVLTLSNYAYSGPLFLMISCFLVMNLKFSNLGVWTSIWCGCNSDFLPSQLCICQSFVLVIAWFLVWISKSGGQSCKRPFNVDQIPLTVISLHVIILVMSRNENFPMRHDLYG